NAGGPGPKKDKRCQTKADRQQPIWPRPAMRCAFARRSLLSRSRIGRRIVDHKIKIEKSDLARVAANVRSSIVIAARSWRTVMCFYCAHRNRPTGCAIVPGYYGL